MNMKIYRNKTKGIITKEYRDAMNTPKRMRLIKDKYNKSTFIFETDITEKQFIRMLKNKVIVDTECPNIMECADTTNCCVCENLSKFIQMTDTEKFILKMNVKRNIKEETISQISDKEEEIENWKSKEIL